ncbi:MAG: DUF1553 domain-containing protein [Planctomycetaceae bacterium]|nr:DUF1553 domain-containing protein [Planctomycetaceae bacterium]
MQHRKNIRRTLIGSIARAVVACLLTSFACQSRANGDEDSPYSAVADIFQQHCVSCHNNIDRKGELSLQSPDDLRDGGLIDLDAPASSHLLAVLLPNDDSPPNMPKDSPPLTTEQVELVRNWLASGAEWPDGHVIDEPVVDDFDWWSFLPLTRPPVPSTQRSENVAWIRTPIDAFILDRSSQLGLTHAPEADRRTLIRRLTYDLTGLPPTPEEVRAFTEDTDPLAYERLVDRLLASPRYGERWARHWLDVVKYADTCGYDKDKLRPNAWPYRDYVIRSFNEDKPYARFVQEQVAGDVLFPGEPDGILGLGLIAAGPWDFIGHVEVSESKIDGKVARNLDRDDMVSGVFNTFCSVTIQCARCHNHKFDPFTQQHYYGLQSVFAAVDRAERPYDIDPAIEQRRFQLEQQIAQAQADRKELHRTIREEGGEPLKLVEQKIDELKPLAQVNDKHPAFGYHSQMATEPSTEKWVEIDLGEVRRVDRIVLRPCHDDFNGIGAGFGFPVRYRITATAGDGDSQQAEFVTLADRTEDDQPNPGLLPVEFTFDPTDARVIRVTATKLAERKDDFIFALAELQVFAGDEVNRAEGSAVNALDSIEAPVRWARGNLTDGQWAHATSDADIAKLADAENERREILKRVVTPERQTRLDELAQLIQRSEEELQSLPAGPVVYAAATHFKPQGNFKPTAGMPRDVRMLHRGNIQQPLEPATPGVIPLSPDDVPAFDLDPDAGEGERRADLARWLTQDDHPLTWRSIVNRVWQYHFGRGLVESPNDFGRMGQLPSHPELLDWLAVEFRDNGGSFKHLHRLIVTSAVYRQASTHNDANALIDAGNQYLWRMNRRRLSAEEIRDTLLAVSGRLNSEMGGPGFYLFELERTEHSPHYEYHKHDPTDPASHRRAVYRFIVRSQPDPFMTTLDCADSSQSTPRRTETLTSLQALSMLNNGFNLTMAESLANRLQSESIDLATQVTQAVTLLTGQSPSPETQDELTSYADVHGLPNLCRLLFNLSEVMFVD